MKLNLIFVLFISISIQLSYTQGVAINTDGTPAHASAILDIKSTSKGLLVPRMTKAQRDAISSPAAGLMIYQIDNTPGYYYYNGNGWSGYATNNSVWGLTGNSGTNPNTNFLGTLDDQPLRFRLNNTWAGELDPLNGNVAIGDSSGIGSTTGFLNTSIGHKSFKANTSGFINTAIGFDAMSRNTTGNANTAIGFDAMRFNTTGNENTAVGNEALRKNITGTKNTAIGSGCLSFTESIDSCTAVGYYALHHAEDVEGNTAVGSFALTDNLTGDYNSAFGASAMENTTTGADNAGLGSYSLYFNTSGKGNTGVGASAMSYNSTGNFNTAVGNYALHFATSEYNAAVGQKSAFFTSTGGGNTSMGAWALYNNTTGALNTAVGNESLAYNYTGVYNSSLGAFSGVSNSVNNTISIGNHGYLNGGNNQVFIGNLSSTWNGGNVTWSTYSDARVKTDIEEDVKGLDFITRLRPVTYHRDIDLQTELTGNKQTENFPNKYDIEQIKFSGFLAQEVEQAALASGYDFSGITKPRNENELYTLSYESFVVPLVKAVQEQQLMIQEQNQKIISLEERLAAVEAKADAKPEAEAKAEAEAEAEAKAKAEAEAKAEAKAKDK